MFHSFANIQKMQCADFVFKCLNKTATYVSHAYFEKINHHKATRANGS